MATINYEFRISEVPPGSALLVGDVAVFNVGGSFCAVQDKCTHRQGPLSQGKLDGSTVTCPYHGAQFNVCTGAVLRGPAGDSLKTYRVIVDGQIGRIETGQVQQSETATKAAGKTSVAGDPFPEIDLSGRSRFQLLTAEQLMSNTIRHYTDDKIDISYDARRCIHAAECVHGLPVVFDTAR